MNGLQIRERFGICLICSLVACAAAPVQAFVDARPEPVRALGRMSLEELANVQVTSVSKSAQAVSQAPAAIYVITRDEILRAGVLSIPEALRLAPNLQVAQLTSADYAISARGFGGNPDLQNFPNKILILIDGRTVYSPLFSGVPYDGQDVLMDDIDRIEVISGPGATLWGANAMNGVINIITRTAGESRGGLLRVTGGTGEDAASARYGGNIGDVGAYRVYGKAFARDAMELEDGSDARDDWEKAQGGFRVDLTRDNDRFTFQGDLYSASRDQAGEENVDFSGSNALARWTHTTGRLETSLQAYFDRTTRESPVSGVGLKLDTWDIELQQAVRVGSRHAVVWGAGGRNHHYRIDNSASLQFVPAERTLRLGNVFLQDTIALTPRLHLTGGVKLERDAFTGWTALPDLRLSWSPTDTAMIWAAASRAIRSPTPFDVDVVEIVDDTVFLTGAADFQSEKVTGYEIGYRGQAGPAVSLSVSAFFDVLDDLRTIETASATEFLPLRWDNEMEGEAWGVEAWATFQALSWWQVSPGVRTLHKRLDFKPGASELLPVGQAGNDPAWQAQLKSSMSIGCCVSLDAYLRYVDDLPDPATSDYTELTARLGWRVSSSLELSLNGLNLLHANHREYAEPAGQEITRNVTAELRWTF